MLLQLSLLPPLQAQSASVWERDHPAAEASLAEGRSVRHEAYQALHCQAAHWMHCLTVSVDYWNVRHVGRRRAVKMNPSYPEVRK